MEGFKSRFLAQRFLETHAAFYNALNAQRHLFSPRALHILSGRSESDRNMTVA